MDRFGPSILVEAGGELFMFDTGRGCLQRLQQLGHEYRDVRAVFLTHLHSDHIVGLPDFWLTGWIVSRAQRPLTLFGPVGTVSMAHHLEEAFAYDRAIRVSDRPANSTAPHTNPAGGLIRATEIREGVVYKANGVTVTAVLVDHRPVTPAFGYRIDFAGHSVVLSGDTRFSENLLKWSTGVDLLVHEVAFRTGQTQANSAILAHHTMPDQAGELFARAKPKLAVYSHVIVSRDISDDRLMQMTRATYNGPLVVGADLMSFDIGDRVQINPPADPSRPSNPAH